METGNDMRYKNLMQEMYGIANPEQKKKVLPSPIRIERPLTVVEKLNKEIQLSPIKKLINEIMGLEK